MTILYWGSTKCTNLRMNDIETLINIEKGTEKEKRLILEKLDTFH